MTGKRHLGTRGRRFASAVSIAVGLLVLPTAGALAPIGLGAAAARADEASAPVVLDHLSFRWGPNTIEIPRVEARGTALTGAELRDILDPASGLTSAQRLARLSAAAIAAAEIIIKADADGAGGTPGPVVTIHDVLLSDVRAGKAASLSIRAVGGTARSDKAEDDIFSIGPVTAHAVDPALALVIATDKRTDRDLPLSPLYGDLAVSDLKVKDSKGGTLSIGRIDSGALEGRPLLETTSDLLKMSEQFSSAAPPGDEGRFHHALLDAANSFKLARLQISGLAFAERTDRAKGFRVRTIQLEGLEALKAALFRVEDAALDADGVHLSMARMALSNLDQSGSLGTMLARLMGGMPAPAAPPPPVAPAGMQLKVENIHMMIPTPTNDGAFPAGTVNVMDIPVIEFGESVAPGSTTVESYARTRFQYDLPSAGTDPSIQSLRDAGLSRIDVSFRSKLGYDTAARKIRLDELAVDGRDMASVSLAGRVENLPEAPFDRRATTDETMARLAEAKFHDLKLTIADHGLMKLVMPFMARSAGTSEAMMRAGLKTQVDLKLPDLLGLTPAEATVARAIDGFLDDPGTLVLSVRAPEGMAFGDIGAADDPVALARQLDITAEAHR